MKNIPDRLKSLLWLLAAMVWLSGARLAPAQTLLLKFQGTGAINGSSVINGHANEIGVSSFSFGLDISASGGAGGVSYSAPDFSDITLQKPLDVASPLLALNCAKGPSIDKATLFFLKSGGTNLLYTIDLTKVRVTGDSVSGDNSGQPSESISLHFETITWTYYPATGSPVISGWNLSTQTSL